jgi:hypothetical protein
MRHFWLKKNGQTWDLTSNAFTTKKSFFASPNGLGVKVKIESYEVERATFIESVALQGAEISGSLYFGGYAQFGEFAEFIGYVETTEPMRLYYSTVEEKPDYDSPDEWYKLVLVQELKKGEIDLKTGMLVCEVKFAALSRWKRDKVITMELTPYGTPLVYPYSYPYYYGGQSNMAAEIDNTGNLPTHCTVKVEPETDTPLFRIIVDGTAVEQAKYNVYVRAGQYLLVDSNPASQEASVYTQQSGGTLHREDVYYLGERDYAYSNFITIPTGKSTFLFTAANNAFGRVTLSFSQQREVI